MQRIIKPSQKVNECICKHAEANLFGKLTKEQTKRSGEKWVIILPFSPCMACAKLLIEKKINYVIILTFSKQHPNYVDPIPEFDKNLPFLRKNGITVVKI